MRPGAPRATWLPQIPQPSSYRTPPLRLEKRNGISTANRVPTIDVLRTRTCAAHAAWACNDAGAFRHSVAMPPRAARAARPDAGVRKRIDAGFRPPRHGTELADSAPGRCLVARGGAMKGLL